MTIAKLVLMLVCLMPVALNPNEAKVTPLFSKDLPDFPGKQRLMTTVEYPPGAILMFGVSTAMIFTVILRLTQARFVELKD